MSIHANLPTAFYPTIVLQRDIAAKEATIAAKDATITDLKAALDKEREKVAKSAASHHLVAAKLQAFEGGTNTGGISAVVVMVDEERDALTRSNETLVQMLDNKMDALATALKFNDVIQQKIESQKLEIESQKSQLDTERADTVVTMDALKDKIASLRNSLAKQRSDQQHELRREQHANQCHVKRFDAQSRKMGSTQNQLDTAERKVKALEERLRKGKWEADGRHEAPVRGLEAELRNMGRS